MLSVEQVMGGVLFFTHAVARCVLGSHLAAHIFPQWLGFFVLAANGVNAWFVQGAWPEPAASSRKQTRALLECDRPCYIVVFSKMFSSRDPF